MSYLIRVSKKIMDQKQMVGSISRIFSFSALKNRPSFLDINILRNHLFPTRSPDERGGQIALIPLKCPFELA
jgi:hypothetical protein